MFIKDETEMYYHNRIISDPRYILETIERMTTNKHESFYIYFPLGKRFYSPKFLFFDRLKRYTIDLEKRHNDNS